MVSGMSPNKRLYSNMELNHEDDKDQLDDSQRRDYIREHKLPIDDGDGDYGLISSSWYNNFFEGVDAPVILAKGEAGEKISMYALNKLIEWYGIEESKLAYRIANTQDPNRPFAVMALDCDKTVIELDGVDTESEVWAATIYAQFVSEPDILRYARTKISLDTRIADIELSEKESIVISQKSAHSSPLGRVGLNNMGNTCFMNSSLQALLHIPELVNYFGSGEFKVDLNRMNPIGCQGQVAEAFASLVRQTYAQDIPPTSVRPNDFLRTIGRFNRAFSSRMQQDSQEFTAFLLDSLHEDVNRIRDKPATEKPELPDSEAVTDADVRDLAAKSWSTHEKRNSSKIMDLFTGMYKSTLICPVCGKISITFDPFFDLTLPLPSSNVWMKKVIFVPHATATISSLTVALQPNNTISSMKQQVAELLHLPEGTELAVGDLYSSKFYRLFKDTDVLVDAIDPTDDIAIYELPPVTEADASPVPVYLRHENRGCGMPFFIVVDSNSTAESLESQISARLLQQESNDTTNRETQSEESASDKAFCINVFDGDIDELLYGYGDSRLHPFNQPPIVPHSGSTGIEPFVNLQPEKPENEVSENLPTPASSPNAAPYSPDGSSSSSSSSISPLSSTDSLSEPPSGPEEDRQLPQIQVPLRNTDGIDDHIPSVSHNEGESQKWDPHNMVLVVDVQADVTAANASDLPYKENPAAQRAEAALKDKKNTTLQDCLRLFSQPEVLGEQDVWYCPRCKDFRQAQKQLELWQAPEILMIHLKRFSGMHNMSRKINDLVKFPLEGLDLSDFVSPAAITDREMVDNDGVGNSDDFVYDLFAVDNHYGGMGGGHYTAYVKDPFTGEWLDFNDSFVKQMEPGNVCTEAAYLLFYRKRSTNQNREKEAGLIHERLRTLNTIDNTISTPATSALASTDEPQPQQTSPITTANTAGADHSSLFTGEGRVLGGRDEENDNDNVPNALPWANV